MSRLLLASIVGSSLVFLGGCRTGSDAHHGHHHATTWKAVDSAVAVVRPTAGNQCRGVVVFKQAPDGVTVSARITGLTPGAKHAFHIHQFGDARTRDGKSAGGHYNPGGHAHGRPTDAERHAGDLGNLMADGAGNAVYSATIEGISIAGMNDPIIGRGVIVHAGEDKFIQPTGGAGARIGIGVIGVANPN